MKLYFKFLFLFVSLFFFRPADSVAETVSYDLHLARERVPEGETFRERVTVNGSVPGPTLFFKEGDTAVIRITNGMKEVSSVHWHGLLVPAEMDGVPGLNGFSGIQPGETFTARFELRQSGTYWYHAHSEGQEQEGLYGALVILPKEEDEIKTERDVVIVLSESHLQTPERLLSSLKTLHGSDQGEGHAHAHQRAHAHYDDSDQHAHAQHHDHMHDHEQLHEEKERHGHAAHKPVTSSQEEGALERGVDPFPPEHTDVEGYHFLLNGKEGKTPEQSWVGSFKKGERIRLRLINASAMSTYDVQIPSLTLQVVAADGQDIVPVEVDALRLSPAETYDVVIQPQEEKRYRILAASADRTGGAVGMLAPLLKAASTPDTSVPIVSLAELSRTPRVLTYKDLQARKPREKVLPPEQTVFVHLEGNEDTYQWALNGSSDESGQQKKPFSFRNGERLRLVFENDTEMAHPMHLHGMFFQLENGQPPERLPNKHTVTIHPGERLSVLLTADAAGLWAFHCHLLYHMLGGMMEIFTIAEPGSR